MELEEILAEIKKLEPEQKIHLISEILAEDPSISIILDSNRLKGDIAYQSDVMSSSQGAAILKSIAEHVANDYL